MKNNIFKRVIVALLVLAMCWGVVACGKDTDGDGSQSGSESTSDNATESASDSESESSSDSASDSESASDSDSESESASDSESESASGSESDSSIESDSTSESESASDSESESVSDSASESVSDSDSESESADSSEIYFDIIKDGVALPVMYGFGATPDEIQLAKTFADNIFKATGVSTTYDVSFSYKADKPEIVIGNGSASDYPEIEEAVAELGYGEGIAKIIGNKLVIVGADNDSITQVINELTKRFRNSKDEDGNVKLARSFTISKYANELVAQMPVLSSYTPTVVDRNNNCYSFEFSTKKTTFDKYLKLLGESGFEVYATNTIDENVYTTYVNRESQVVATAIYTKYNGICRLVMDWLYNTELPTKAEDNEYTPIAGLESSITQVGLWYATETTPLISDAVKDSSGRDRYYYNYFNGMNYVIRLADGSFIVVDSGHDNAVQAQNLYNILKEQAPDPDNIVIAAWFISHDHGDHTSMFKHFLGKYKDVAIERFIYNFPGEALGNSNESSQLSLRSLMMGFYPDAAIVKAHPGQEFYIRNAKITMLYTMDVFEKELTDTNNASIVWKMELDGKTFMCLGDYSDSGDTLMKLYSNETLKSDIVQVAHHGISGMSNSLYVKIAPEYAFWPVANFELDWDGLANPINITDTWEGEMNKYILDMDDSKVFVARDDVSIITISDGAISTAVYDNVTEYISAN